MQKFLLILSIPLLLTGCESLPWDPGTVCEDQRAGQPINIHYGDSQIKVTPPLYTINTKKNLKFRLIADNVNGPGGLDYATVKVTIKSKDWADRWINTSGTEQGTNPLVVCVPAGATGPADQKIVEYLVEVEKVGMLDPRVDVKK